MENQGASDKKILVSGCSHVFGHGFNDSVDGTTPSVHAWPAKIRRDFGCEIVNLSGPGQSPSWCIEQIQNYQPKSELAAILIIFPFSARKLMRKRLKDGTEEDTPYCFNFTVPKRFKRWKEIADSYYLLCHNYRSDIVDIAAYIGYLKSLSFEYGFPVWVSTSEPEDHKSLKSRGVQLDSDLDWSSYANKNQLPKLPDGHYGALAHESFYQEYIKPWLVEKVFDQKS